jgi:hypothetical protein
MRIPEVIIVGLEKETVIRGEARGRLGVAVEASANSIRMYLQVAQ